LKLFSVKVSWCYDVGRIENVHFWPFNGPAEHRDFYFEYLAQVERTFVFGRTDWEYVLNTFCCDLPLIVGPL
jgi:hypothetical protein